MVRGISSDATLARHFGRRPGDSDVANGGVVAQSVQRTSLAVNLQQSSESGLSLSNEAQLAFKLASRSEVRVHEDGSVQYANKTQLRFRYDLQTDDGQQIQLHARAKFKQTATLDENGDIAIKTRVKLQFSLIQSDIAESVRPLLGGNSAEGSPLDNFLNVVNDAVSGFVDDGTVDADTLVNSVLEEFNLLFNEVSTQTGAGESPPAIEVTPTDSGSESSQSDAESQIAAAEAIAYTEAGVESAADAAAVENAVESAESTSETGEAIEEATGESSDVADPEGVDEVADTGATEESDDAPTVDPAESAREVLTEVRIRFVQSFYGVIRTLSPGESDGANLTQIQQSNFRFAAHLQYQNSAAQDNSTSFLA